MNCETLAEGLTDFLEGDLEPADEAAALEHLSTCESCERVLASTNDTIAVVGEHGRLSLSQDDRDRILNGITGKLAD